MNRLIAAGCSFTNFYWPSWADYLGATLFDKYVNLGAGGAGNRYIFTSLCWMLEHGELTKDDTVIIAWSGIPREDRILPGNHHWEHTGNIHYQDTYPEEGVKKYFSVLSTSTELLSYITSLDLAFKKIGCQVIMTCMFPWHIEKFLGEPAVPLIALDDFKLWKKYGYDQMLEKYYNKYLIKPSIEEFKWKIDSSPNWVMYHPDFGVQDDDHPCSWVHFKYATDILAPLIKRTAKPLKELLNETIEANAKEWSKFYKSKENVASLGMINDFTMKRPNLLWVNRKDIPPKPDMHDFKYIEPWI